MKGHLTRRGRTSVASFARARVAQWECAADISARTAQRYRQLVENQIVPHLGGKALQRLTRLDDEGWHSTLRNGGLAARTIGHAHRVLAKALGDAERDNIIVRNVCKQQKAPKVAEREMVIVRDVPGLIDKLAGERLYVQAVLAVTVGLRLGEVLALTDRRVDLDGRTVDVCAALEETAVHGIRVKTPKSKAGRRKLTLPDVAVDALREHRRELLEWRMKLGIGKLAPDDLLFSTPRRAAPPQHRVVRLGRTRRAPWPARRDVPRAAAHARQPTDREQRRHCHHLEAPWARQAERHPCDLCPHVYKRRQQGGGDQCRLGVAGEVRTSGANPVPKITFRSSASGAKSLKLQVRRGGRVAEGGGLLNRYTV
jgi:integrase